MVSSAGRLARYRVLVVEDDYFVAAEIVAALKENGAAVLGPVSSAGDAGQLVQRVAPDCVLLDINLRGDDAFAFAGLLLERGITTIFTTGYDSSFIPRELQSVSCLRKPVDIPMLLECIRACPPRSLDS